MMRYLTRSYVEWLGLESIVIRKRRSGAVCRLPPNDCLPLPGPSPYVAGVRFEDRLYEMSPCGWSFDLMGAR